jgi:hypothetical protein
MSEAAVIDPACATAGTRTVAPELGYVELPRVESEEIMMALETDGEVIIAAEPEQS